VGEAMTIILHTREIRVSVNEGSINHLIIKNFVARYFSNVLNNVDSIVIMHKESEISQKRYFFQWLYSAYSKQRRNLPPSFLKMLQSAVSFPIYVRIVGKAKPVQSISVRLWLPRGSGSFALSIEPEHSFAVNFFHYRFLPHLINRLGKNQFEIETNEHSLAIFSDLCSRTQILAQPVIFHYERLSMDILFNSVKTEGDWQKQRFFSLLIEEDTKLQNAYRLIGVPLSADMATIKRCYRELAFRYHPDRAYAQGSSAVAENTRRFHAINEAYELICRQEKFM
jgi:hypothetical protein